MKKDHKLLTLTATFGLATLALHGVNKFIDFQAKLKNTLTESGSHTYDWRFGNIYYTKKGTGTPLLLIHDTMPGASGYEWKEVIDSLSQDHTVYTLDLLGCGRSEKPGITYTNFLFVQLICDFIKTIIGEKTDIIASRFSGSYSIMACLHEKDLINKIIMINPHSPELMKKMPTKKDRVLKEILEVPVFGTLIYNMIVCKENTSDLFINSLYYNPFSVDDSVTEAYYEAAHTGGCFAKNLYACYVSKYLNSNVENALRHIPNPVYIITGQDEANVSASEQYTALNSSIETFSVLHTKKLPHVEIPEAFVDVVNDIFAEKDSETETEE